MQKIQLKYKKQMNKMTLKVIVCHLMVIKIFLMKNFKKKILKQIT